MLKRVAIMIAGIVAGTAVLLAGLLAVAIIVTYPRLPSLDILTDYRPKMPLRVYTADSVLIGEFGEERRSFSRIQDVPQNMKQALLAAEDERFYQHGGIDYLGVLRAAVGNVVSGRTHSGASTITMQVAKNFFLSSERTFTRKFNEALLAFKIEHTLSKDQILELYINQIYLGQRAYGFAAAAQAYYGKPLNSLSIAEMAMLAGLPKAPSSYNPIVNPDRARLRQLYVLRRMYELHFITNEQYEAAKAEKLVLARQVTDTSLPAQYVAEMVRQAMYGRYKEAAYTEGYRVYTTLDSHHQQWAFDSLRAGLLDYDRHQSYRGPESFVDLSAIASDELEETLDEALSAIRDSGNMQPAIVLDASQSRVKLYLRGGKRVDVTGSGLSFARFALSDRAPPAQRLRPGAQIRVVQDAKGNWQITQMPEVEGAFVALDPRSGAIKALVGGFDFNRRSFNHVTQAMRQPGSTFKPFIYSAALDRGFTPSTLINDAPLTIDPQTIGGQSWDPKNDDGKYAGMISMRRALALSKNLVSIRIMMAIGPDFAQQYVQRFGFDPKNVPAYLTMALGAGQASPLQMAEAYSVIANGGFRTRAYFVDRIEDADGHVLAKTAPVVAGQNAQQVMDPRNAFIIGNMMKDVVRFGTANRATALGRSDIAGKTGTTSEFRDAWFAGFNPGLVAVTWVGYDQPRSLGRYGYGATAALPIWINYMGNALKGVPDVELPPPNGVVVKPGAGLRGNDEYFLDEFQNTNPELHINNRGSVPGSGNGGSDASDSGSQAPPPPSQDAVENVKEQLF
ncbi:penicillin-binding protein 1A [Vogesella sp. LIG4]|uniref:penicillin-binding protein 1A n=1 Tax=Vogesella sp. LIG4 TaxID=1192162 RepID=UPI00081F9D9C|nr:penicillin-binding protein 1A [Vogesella sp. LIG4]SCK15217.1 penicillin-binding protein 1A [Vogesella sp. LIG4]